MKTLLLLRHAKSSWANMRLADYDRPLNRRGRKDAPQMGRLLQRQDLVPDLIICSSAKRAMATAEFVASASGYAGEIVATRALYHADPASYIQILRRKGADSESVLMVGHNPGMEELLETLLGEFLTMPTAALALLHLPIEQWSSLTMESNGELANLWRPKDIDWSAT